MPDYYYPGFYADKYTPEEKMIIHQFDTTAADKVLKSIGWEKDKFGSLHFDNTTSDFSVDFIPESEIVILKDKKTDVVLQLDWPTFCAFFLKARELEMSRPSCLDKAGPRNKQYKERWIKNQEKIIEIQSQDPDEE